MVVDELINLVVLFLLAYQHFLFLLLILWLSLLDLLPLFSMARQNGPM